MKPRTYKYLRRFSPLGECVREVDCERDLETARTLLFATLNGVQTVVNHGKYVKFQGLDEMR